MKPPRTLTPFILGISIVLITLIFTFQVIYDKHDKPFTTGLPVAKRLLFPEKILPYIDFGFTNILADYYWIRAVQDLSTWNGRDSFYLNYFRNIATLDPKFEYPYLFSILAVPQSAGITKDIQPLNEVAVIAQKGIDAIKEGWQIPFYLATQYHIFTRAYEPAEKYLAIAASKKNAPEGVYLVYSTFVGRNLARSKNINNNPDLAYTTTQDLVKVIYNNTDNETIKELAGKGIRAEFVNQMLEKGIIAYKEKYKRYPKTINEMLAVNFISLPQEFIDAYTVTINSHNGSFTITEK